MLLNAELGFRRGFTDISANLSQISSKYFLDQHSPNVSFIRLRSELSQLA